ncbi:MAG: hypothetical protein L0Z55_00895 [Planctomycetes bacterium]|nr:hypothetical protein [Planctomycetota bacterium]
MVPSGGARPCHGLSTRNQADDHGIAVPRADAVHFDRAIHEEVTWA